MCVRMYVCMYVSMYVCILFPEILPLTGNKAAGQTLETEHGSDSTAGRQKDVLSSPRPETQSELKSPQQVLKLCVFVIRIITSFKIQLYFLISEVTFYTLCLSLFCRIL